ncbi:glycosyltransferase, partial [Photobacterium damselae]
GSEYGDDKINKILSLNGINKSEIDYIQSTNDMSYYYNSSKMCILTSVYEGFPNVLNESIKCCTPVISFDCKSGPSEIINDNNGILIKQYDIDGFVNAIINMLTNPIVIKETPYKSPLQKLVKILGNNHVYK